MVTAVKTLADTVQSLAASVATLTGATGSITGHTRPINIVEKPKAFEGKTSEGACLFRSSFTVWVQDHECHGFAIGVLIFPLFFRIFLDFLPRPLVKSCTSARARVLHMAPMC